MINIVLSSCFKNYIPLCVTVNSIIHNSNNKKNLMFYFISENNKLETVINNVCCYNFNYKIIIPNKNIINEILHNSACRNGRKVIDNSYYINNIFNFIRFYFDKLLPDINKIIYVDTDIIVKGNIEELYDLVDDDNELAAKNIRHMSYKSQIFDENFIQKDDPFYIYGAGIFITYLNVWRKKKYGDKMIYLMKENKKKSICCGGTQTIMNMVIKNTKNIPDEWHIYGLSEVKQKNKKNDGKLLHFSGGFKPWKIDYCIKHNIFRDCFIEWYKYFKKYHIFFSIDGNYNIALYTTINSIIQNCSNPELIMFNILIYDDNKKDEYLSILRNKFPKLVYSFNICSISNKKKQFLESVLKKIVPNKEFNDMNLFNKNVHQNIMNYSRIYFTEIFNNCKYGLYLDTDIIVQTDILELFKEMNDKNFQCYSPLIRNTRDYMSFPEYIPEFDIKLDLNINGFNTGVYLFNCNYWRDNNYTELCEKLLVKNSNNKFMKIGTQPLINLLFNGKTKNIDRRWNIAGLGHKTFIKGDGNDTINETDINNAYILHWSGRKKPWLENGINKQYWLKYK
ncbi:MAG: hypothetical protein CL678_01815 [Bdellovibrionaceae bacterium]|nr:hypothetical protein [Pseudobdellovibrionaceae bacterium]|tara:strand:+ start:4599 stop:6293 length:1695 start_codon:yes stop_codon:yes gene_type:complete